MTDKPKPTDVADKKDEDILEPDEVIFDAAETAFMEAGDDEEPPRK